MNSQNALTIENGRVVSFHYTLTNSLGQLIDSSDGGEPLPYLHGAGNIVPGLEVALVGHAEGDQLTVVVQPKDGYGERAAIDPIPVPRKQFPKKMEIHEGMQFMTEGPNGQSMPVWVSRVEKDQVFMDVNHPLAGQTLHFDVTIVNIRPATSEEMEHGHPHGPDGHHHH